MATTPTPKTATANLQPVAGRGQRIRPTLAREIRRRARKLAVTYPTSRRVAKLDNQALTAVTDVHRAALAVVAVKDTPITVLTSTLLDAHHQFEVFQQADSNDDGGSGDSSDCMRGCDQLLKDCAESWGEAIGGEDIDLFDAEAEDLDPGGGSVGTDDNPLDVENNDPGERVAVMTLTTRAATPD